MRILRAVVLTGALVTPFSVFALGPIKLPPPPRLTLSWDAGQHLTDAGLGDAKRPNDAGRHSDPISNIPPDPKPLVESNRWMFDLRYDKGDILLLTTSHEALSAPTASPRTMGRFALELFEGPTLIERVRFDFPMLGGAPSDPGDGIRKPTDFESRLVTRIGVFFPATNRGTRLELWDRKTDQRWALPWPPVPSSAHPVPAQ